MTNAATSKYPTYNKDRQAKIKEMKKNFKKNLLRKTILVTGTTAGVVTIVVLVKKNRKLHAELITSLEGYLMLLAKHGDLNNDYFNLADNYLTLTERILDKHEALAPVFDQFFGPAKVVSEVAS